MNVLSFASKRLLSVTGLAVILTSVSLAQQVSVSPQVAPRPLITETVDEAQLTVLKGNTHILARPQFDLGTAPATLPMQRMLLVLKRSPEQESALRQLLDDQQDKHSPNYHQWLTPEQFGKEFGPTDADMQTITSWLQSHGFQVGTSKGRTVLEFSGSASQVREAFHTTIHKYIVNGEQHWANASDPSIPTALTPAVAGVLTLHNFVKKPHIRVSKQTVSAKVRPGKSPALTFGDGSHGMAPLDFAKIYNSPAFTAAATTGAGITIGVIGRSNLYSVDSPAEDITDFRSSTAFNLTGGSFDVVLNGPDPGDLGGTEEIEATLDSTWAGAVAPGAKVDLVVSATTNTADGVDLSEVYIIENNLADVMTESFGTCEADDAGEQAGVSALAEQAAAQGITYFVSTGDTGAEGCDDNSETVATGPVSISLTASTPFDVAVGGTVFNDTANPATYWSATTGQESALSYIPEDVWNDSCLAASCGSSANIAAGGGGSSIFFTKPPWQTISGTDTMRDIPDVSLSAAPHDGYVLCVEASCVPDKTGAFNLFLVGGTSASTPSFAGIMALVEANPLLTNPSQSPRQGPANYVLYRLATTEAAYPKQCNGSSTTTSPLSTCIFHDVTVGNDAVPGELHYGLATAQYQAEAGYDMATGLGSVNITNLVNQWSSVTFTATTTTLTLTPATITHGTSVTATGTVAPSSGTGTPTGDVSLIAAIGPSGSSTNQTGIETFTLGTGTFSGTTSQLPGSTVIAGSPVPYNVTARYAGDGTYAPSESAPMPVTVTAEPSTTTLSEFLITTTPAGTEVTQISNGTPLPFGSLVFVRADVVGNSGQGVPTGQVTFTDNGSSKLPGPIFNPVANPVALNSEGNTSIGAGIFNFDGGSHSISASYAGDNSFNASSSTQPVTFIITPGFTGVSGLANVTIASPGGSGTTTIGIIASSNFTTAVSFACTGLPSEASCGTPSATGKGPNTTVTTTITITTTAPHTTMLEHNQRRYYLAAILGGGLPLAGIFLLATPRRRRRSTLVGILMVMTFLLMLPACGGGGGSHTPPPTQDPGTPAGTYSVTVTATAGSLSQQEPPFTLTVQ